jgi:glycosyltransferase involved in cell wall biosynthesis
MEASPRKKILLLGYLPPPYFGPSVAYRALLRSEFGRHFDVTFVDMTVVSRIAELESVRLGKLLRFARFFAREFWCLLTNRFALCCVPVSVNRNAFLKDALLLGLARAFGVPTVVYAHGNNLPDFYEHSAPWVRRVIERTFRRAAGAIVLGERLRFNFERWVSPERIFVAPIGVEPAEKIPCAERRGDLVRVLYLGNLVREKGVFVLLEAAQRIAAQRKDVQFALAGDWWHSRDTEEAERFLATHGLKDRVEFVGPVKGETKWRQLAEADILAFPTFFYYETMGLVLLEAMQAGLPVVTTRRASIPEIVADGVNGLLVEEQNADDLAVKILRLVDDPALRARMGEANRKRFADFYTHEHYGRRMIDVFESICRLPPPVC